MKNITLSCITPSAHRCELIPVIIFVKELGSTDFSLGRVLCLATLCTYSTQYDGFQIGEGCFEAEVCCVLNHKLLKLHLGEILNKNKARCLNSDKFEFRQ